MPLSLGHGKHGEGGVVEEDDWPEGGGENQQEGEEEGVGKTQVLVTPLLQDVLPGFSLSLSLSYMYSHTLSLSHTHTHGRCTHTHLSDRIDKERGAQGPQFRDNSLRCSSFPGLYMCLQVCMCQCACTY